jgi:uncharacterized protein (DUF2236 family)
MSPEPYPSVARKINRERVVLLGWGRAILLQIAHPLVAAAVADHSPFGEDLRGYLQRARRTVGAMLRLTFGTDDEARRVVAGRRCPRTRATRGRSKRAVPATRARTSAGGRSAI